jgi:hypothetical protein
VQGVEVGDAVDTEHHGLAVDHELAVLQRGLDDPGIAAAPLVAVAGEQAHALAILPQRAILKSNRTAN